MARIQKPQPGRLVVSVIYASMDALADAVKALEKKFGRIQFETLEIPCAEAAEYREEMGDSLLRRFFSFERQLQRDALYEVKAICHKIEPEFADTVDDYPFRTVNLDPGLVTPDNLIMSSHKEMRHRIYLRDGVFAELTLIYSSGRYCRLPWTNSDFCDEEAINFFERVRQTIQSNESVSEPLKL